MSQLKIQAKNLLEKIKETRETLNGFLMKIKTNNGSKRSPGQSANDEQQFQQDIEQSKELYPETEQMTYYQVSSVHELLKECEDQIDFNSQKCTLIDENSLGGIDKKISEQIAKIKSIDEKNIDEREIEQKKLKQLQTDLRIKYEQRKNEIDNYTGDLSGFDIEFVEQKK